MSVGTDLLSVVIIVMEKFGLSKRHHRWHDSLEERVPLVTSIIHRKDNCSITSLKKGKKLSTRHSVGFEQNQILRFEF